MCKTSRIILTPDKINTFRNSQSVSIALFFNNYFATVHVFHKQLDIWPFGNIAHQILWQLIPVKGYQLFCHHLFAYVVITVHHSCSEILSQTIFTISLAKFRADRDPVLNFLLVQTALGLFPISHFPLAALTKVHVCNTHCDVSPPTNLSRLTLFVIKRTLLYSPYWLTLKSTRIAHLRATAAAAP